MFISGWRRFLNTLSLQARGQERRSRRKVPAKPSCRLRLEYLEERCTPATVTYTQAIGLLQFAGLTTSDDVTVTAPAANQVVIQVGNADQITLAGDAAASADFLLSTTTNANDTLTINTASGHAPLVNFNVNLNDGNDFLTFGLANATNGVTNVNLQGDAGIDTVTLNTLTIGGNLMVGFENLNVVGTAGNDTLVVNATSANSGSYSLNGGAAVPFSNITSFSFVGMAGSDTLTINNPAGSLFAPSGGIFYDGGGQSGDNLQIVGGTATTATFNYNPDTAEGHDGTIAFVNGLTTADYSYQGLSPISSTVTAANVIFNLPTGDGNNQAILEDNGNLTDGISQIRSGNGTFETTTFTDPTTSLTVNDGNDGETVTVARLDNGFTAPITVNGGTSVDALRVNFSSGVDVIPTGGVTFAGAGGNDSIALLPGYTATNVTHNYTDNHSGNIVVDGRTLSYTGLSQTSGIFDQLAAGIRTFNFSSTVSNNITLGDDPTANNRISRISSTASNPTTDFANPTTSVTVNLGNAGDTITAGPLDATSPPPAIDLNGGTGSDTFDVTPGAASTFNVDGNLPNPPALPGDTLNVTIPPGSNPVLTSVATPIGFTGNYTFLAGGFQPVNFTRIETLSPTTVDLAITKDDGADAEGEIPGSTITYTIVATNTSSVSVTGVTITDMFPASMPPSTAPGFTSDTFTSTVTGGATGNTASGSGNINDTATMPGGSTITYIVTAVINPSSLGTLSNTATITAPTGVTDSNTANNTSTDSDPLTPMADLAIAKTGAPNPVLAGNDLTYTITVTDNGPSTSQNVQLTDAVPTNTTFVSFAAPAGWTTNTPPAGGTGQVTASDPSLLPGTATFTLVVRVNPNTPNTTIISNQASINSTTTVDQVSTNNVVVATNTVNTSADVGITKTGPTTANAGQNVTYTLSVTNNGPSDAQGVTTSDTLPSNTTLVSFTQTSGPGNGGTLPAGGTETFQLVVTANSNTANGATITNTANVSSTTPDANAANNSSAVGTVITTSADVQVTKTGPATFTASQNITYTITFSNTGPSDAPSAVLTDSVPAGTTFVSFTAPAGWTITNEPAPGGTGLVRATDPDVVAGAGPQLFTLVVATNATGGTTVSNTATGLSGAADPNTANNDSTVMTTVNASADLAVTKTGPATANAGQNVTYTLSVTNNGPSDAQNVMVNDTLPAGETFVSASTGSGAGAAYSSGNLGALAAGASTTITIVAVVSPSEPSNSILTDSAMVSSSTTDPNASNNTATFNTTVGASADLAITKTGPATANAGTNVTYTLSVTNNGPSNAQNVLVTDTLPSGETFVSASEGSGAGASFVDLVGAFVAGATRTITLVATISPTVPNGATETDTATVASTTTDSNAANNTVTFNTTVNASADLAVTKTGPATANAGQSVTYTLSVTNNGPTDAQNVMVTDTLPADETFVSASTGSGAGTAYSSGNLGTLAAGGSTTITLVAMISPAVSNGATETDTATVASTTSDSNAANNTATFNTTVGASADLAITKTGPATAFAGNNVTYTLSVTNNGPSDAQNVLVTDTLPAGETFVSASEGSGAGTSYVDLVGAFAAGAARTITLVATISPTVANGTIETDTATVASTTSDSNAANNTATFNTTVNTSADLAVTKTGPATAFAGQNVTYTLSVTNNGPSDAQNVMVNDTLPAGETFVSASTGTGAGAAYSSGNLGTLAASGSTTITLVAMISPAVPNGTTETDTATVASTTSDSNAANNTATFITTVNSSADLAVVKTGPAAVVAGTNATYTLSVTNAGPSDAQGVTLSDAVPAGSTFVSFTQNTGPTFSAALPPVGGTGTLNDFISTLASGASATFTLVLHLASSDVNQANFSNTANISSSGTPDPVSANNSSTATAPVREVVDLSITKTDNQTTAHPGLPVTYTIVVSNSGPSDATNATVTDAFPSDLNNVTFTTTETGGANGFTPSGNGNIHDTVNVPLGATITYIATGTVDSSATGGILSNTATVEPSSVASDPNTANNSATDADALAPLSGAIVVNGTAGNETVVVTATGPDDGSYTVNGGPAIPFSNITSFTFNGGPGDSLIVHNPAGGVFAPSGGVIYNGGSGANSLQILDGFAPDQIFTFSPNSAGGGHNGTIAFVNGATTANYTYSNLTPVLVNAGTPNAVVFNLPKDGQDDKAVVQAAGAMSEIVSQVSAFETTTFVNPSTSLTINVPGTTAETLTLGPLGSGGVIPSIVLNGGPGADAFNVQAIPNTVVTVNGGAAPNVLNFDAQGQSIGIGAGAIALKGRPAVLYANVATLNLNNAASVESIAGPDTANRPTAFTGLSAQEHFVQALYLDELGRAGARAELDGWVGVLNGPGGSQTIVAGDILRSQEARDHLVRSWYVTFLGRQADGTEELGFVNQLLQGQTEEQVLSEILGSSEFDGRAQTLSSTGTTQQRDVQALYELLLNRTGGSVEVAGWVGLLPRLGLQGVAQAFLTSQEFRGDLFEGYYNALLHRPSDPAISNAVFSNLDAATFRVDFEASPEFFTNG